MTCPTHDLPESRRLPALIVIFTILFSRPLFSQSLFSRGPYFHGPSFTALIIYAAGLSVTITIRAVELKLETDKAVSEYISDLCLAVT